MNEWLQSAQNCMWTVCITFLLSCCSRHTHGLKGCMSFCNGLHIPQTITSPEIFLAEIKDAMQNNYITRPTQQIDRVCTVWQVNRELCGLSGHTKQHTLSDVKTCSNSTVRAGLSLPPDSLALARLPCVVFVVDKAAGIERIQSTSHACRLT